MNDKLISINDFRLDGLDDGKALKRVRETLHPDFISRCGVVDICVERASIDKQSDNTQTGRHNDSYILATQFGIKTFSLDPSKGINRSQSLQEKTKRYKNDSVIYKGKFAFGV